MKKTIFLFFLLIFASATLFAAQTGTETATPSKQKRTAQKTIRKQASAKATNSTRDKTRQKQAAEKKQEKLRQQLTTLKKAIDQTEKAKGKAAEELAESEKAISTTRQSLSALEMQKNRVEKKLAQLLSEQNTLLAAISQQQIQLAKIIQQQYISGRESRMKLLFSGDNPNRINRELQYMRYFSTAHTSLIHSLENNLESVNQKKTLTTEAKQELDKIVAQTHQQKALLEKEKAQHAVLLAQLSEKLDAQKKEAERLAQDEQRLAGLVNRLNRDIEAQRKAAEQKEAQRRLAAQKKQRQTNRTQPKRQQNTAQDDTDTIQSAPYSPPDTTTAFGKMRGKLNMPVSGTITARYGMKRTDGPSWKGIFIKTSEGAPIHAVASGRVIFADFLRGFGNLIILDHGNHYMTIYGNAQSLSKRVGDYIAAGEAIDNAGNSGENTETGLYFEIRHNGRAYDPLDWIR